MVTKAACGLKNSPTNLTGTQENVEYYIHTNKLDYNSGETVQILYRVTNRSNKPVDLGYSVLGLFSCRFDITDDEGKRVWKWPWVTPLGPSRHFRLGPYESKEFELNWDMINDNGTLRTDDDFAAGPGIYNIAGELNIEPEEDRVPVSVSVTIEGSGG